MVGANHASSDLGVVAQVVLKESGLEAAFPMKKDALNFVCVWALVERDDRILLRPTGSANRGCTALLSTSRSRASFLFLNNLVKVFRICNKNNECSIRYPTFRQEISPTFW